MKKFTYKELQILLTLISLIILALSFYFEYVKHLQPCPLCLMQRFFVLIIFFLSFTAVYIRFLKTARLLSILQIIAASLGLFLALRQIWLQNLPSNQIPACLPDISILIRYFPWKDLLHALFWGTGNCAEVTWTWLGLSMPAWSALYFIFIILASVFIHWSLKTRPFYLKND